jgi:hypothetical protein
VYLSSDERYRAEQREYRRASRYERHRGGLPDCTYPAFRRVVKALYAVVLDPHNETLIRWWLDCVPPQPAPQAVPLLPEATSTMEIAA